MTEEDQASLDWVRSRPAVIQEMMKKFPPSCVVRATRELRTPAPGRLGVLASYKESGLVSVVDQEVWNGTAPAHIPPLRADCDPAWLEVVSYLGNMTPEWVEKVIGGEDIAPVLEN
jgi:hypothetical protein